MTICDFWLGQWHFVWQRKTVDSGEWWSVWEVKNLHVCLLATQLGHVATVSCSCLLCVSIFHLLTFLRSLFLDSQCKWRFSHTCWTVLDCVWQWCIWFLEEESQLEVWDGCEVWRCPANESLSPRAPAFLMKLRRTAHPAFTLLFIRVNMYAGR